MDKDNMTREQVMRWLVQFGSDWVDRVELWNTWADRELLWVECWINGWLEGGMKGKLRLTDKAKSLIKTGEEDENQSK